MLKENRHLTSIRFFKLERFRFFDELLLRSAINVASGSTTTKLFPSDWPKSNEQIGMKAIDIVNFHKMPTKKIFDTG